MDVLQEISSAIHYVDILQAITRKLGGTYGLDRCSIFLTSEPGAAAGTVRLVASYEDQSLRNAVVDLARYPELRQVFESGESIHVPDVTTDPMFAPVAPLLAARDVQAIVVVPIKWRLQAIGALFVRTKRGTPPLAGGDLHFLQVIAGITARALRNAHRFEALLASSSGDTSAREADRQRVALIGTMRRVLEEFSALEEQSWMESLLDREASEQLDRTASVVMKVVAGR